MSTPFQETGSEGSGRDRKSGRVLPGNQIARKYPKPPAEDDSMIAQRLRERVEQIVVDRGGADQIGTVKRGAIERYAVLELHVESWERFFLKAGFVTRQGRVRSGYAGGYLASVTQLMRLAQIIGLDKQPRTIRETPAEWLSRSIVDRTVCDSQEQD